MEIIFIKTHLFFAVRHLFFDKEIKPVSIDYRFYLQLNKKLFHN